MNVQHQNNQEPNCEQIETLSRYVMLAEFHHAMKAMVKIEGIAEELEWDSIRDFASTVGYDIFKFLTQNFEYGENVTPASDLAAS